MANVKGSASYKKKNGTLQLNQDGSTLVWTPTDNSGQNSTLKIAVGTITNLQATPESNPKAMLRVSRKIPDTEAAETHVFTFTSSAQARPEANAVKDALSQAIQRSKAASSTANGAGSTVSGQSAAMAIASALSSNPQSSDWLDDTRLKSDSALQQSLLKSDAQLGKTFIEALKTKPSSVSNSYFTAQFWSSRIHLLRAHAIEKTQSRGAYNVLSTMKPVNVDNETKMKINHEQIQLIFKQHPLVKRVYDENVPKLNESEFWSQFFTSRLLKKLKGEKYTDADPPHPLLDKYLQYDPNSGAAPKPIETQVPHFIDLEGNEENHSQRKGNLPDWTMRPSSADKVPIIRTLNSLSEKIMSQVAPSDINPAEPIGMNEETFKELALKDLQRESEDSGIKLSLKDQQRFFQNESQDGSKEDEEDSRLRPKQIIATLKPLLDRISSSKSETGLDLDTMIGVKDDEDSDDEEDDTVKLGNSQSIKKSREQILKSVNLRRSHMKDDLSSSREENASSKNTTGLSTALYDRMQLTNATTAEFLRHFWQLFLSGDPKNVNDLAGMVESLSRALDRIEAVAKDADVERKRVQDEKKREIREAYQRDGRKRKFDFDSVPGGAQVVRQILGPQISAVGVAMDKYKKALLVEGVDLPQE